MTWRRQKIESISKKTINSKRTTGNQLGTGSNIPSRKMSPFFFKKLEREQEKYEQPTDLYEPPPPAYSPEQQLQQAGNITSTTPKYPPQSHHMQSPTLTLQTENIKLLGTALRIYDLADPRKDLYNVKIKWNMNLHFLRPPGDNNNNEEEIASVKFHKFSMKMDIQLPDAPMFTVGVKLGQRYETSYSSPAMDGRMVSWKVRYHWKTTDLEFRDSAGVMLARIKASNYKWKKMSQIEFFGDAWHNRRLVDEVVVVGGAVLEFVLVTASTVAGAAS